MRWVKLSDRNGKKGDRKAHTYESFSFTCVARKFVDYNCNYFPANGSIAAEREIPYNNKKGPIPFSSLYEQCWSEHTRRYFPLPSFSYIQIHLNCADEKHRSGKWRVCNFTVRCESIVSQIHSNLFILLLSFSLSLSCCSLSFCYLGQAAEKNPFVFHIHTHSKRKGIKKNFYVEFLLPWQF